MGKWRDEVKVLSCGCRVGRSNNGLFFYDYICPEHLPEVYDNGHYSYEKAEEMTKKMNEKMKRIKAEEKKNGRVL